ncbi:MAG: hypothetical protein RMI89_10445 [Gloeomargarita sp. SKYBB_i_bin120]|nr:hypothetical protein [Gloeomargarita sp. SKYG98]MCS7293370.1 hypothetical protein [Gloeomargarita sp. SKYB120]MDW8178935.1 hypothetical protein [Gloeomargarita sp. SKYBB_i_bin120]
MSASGQVTYQSWRWEGPAGPVVRLAVYFPFAELSWLNRLELAWVVFKGKRLEATTVHGEEGIRMMQEAVEQAKPCRPRSYVCPPEVELKLQFNEVSRVQLAVRVNYRFHWRDKCRAVWETLLGFPAPLADILLQKPELEVLTQAYRLLGQNQAEH